MSVVAPLLGGWWLDKRFGTQPTLTFVGLGLGSVAGFWLLFKTARQLSKDADAEDARQRTKRRDE